MGQVCQSWRVHVSHAACMSFMGGRVGHGAGVSVTGHVCQSCCMHISLSTNPSQNHRFTKPWVEADWSDHHPVRPGVLLLCHQLMLLLLLLWLWRLRQPCHC